MVLVQTLINFIEWAWSHRAEITILGAVGFLLRELSKQLIKSQINKHVNNIFGNNDLRRIESKVDYLIALNGGEPWNSELMTSESAGVLSYRRLWRGYLKVIFQKKSKFQRRITMNLLKNANVRNLTYFLVGLAVSILNSKLGLNIDANSITTLWGVILALILREAHFSMKSFISGAVNGVSAAAQQAAVTSTGAPIQTVVAPPMSYEQMVPYLQDISKEMTAVYDAIKTGKYNESTQQAINVAMTLHEYLTKNKGA
jgi:hypothetical protein